MESLPGDPYERQLLEVFKSCDCDGKGLLDNDGLSRLCEMLHLEDGRDELMSFLLPNGTSSSAPSISFIKFRDALLALLGGVSKAVHREPSPEREVSPKYVFGQKKYGRRSRPESTEQLDLTSNLEVPENTNGEDPEITIINQSNLDTDDSQLYSSQELNDKDSDDLPFTRAETPVNAILLNKECEDSGESELRNAWERLGVGRDGFLHQNELAMVCSAVGMDTMADQVVAQVFSTLKTDDEGRISFEEFLELFRSRSRVPSPQILETSPIQFKSLLTMDQNELSGDPLRLYQDLQIARTALDAVTEERDKLRADLLDANHRASLLAQEIDEHHARIEKSSRDRAEFLEQKHAEELKDLKLRMVTEKDQLLASNHKLEQLVTQHLEQLNKLSAEMTSLKKDYEVLEKENQALNTKLIESNSIRQECQEQIECMQALHQRVIELEALNEQSSGLIEKINNLQIENTELRDKNDELTSQLEVYVSKTSLRKESSLDFGSGTKRRGKSPELFNDSRLGKVRRCSTETDLSMVSQPTRIRLYEPNDVSLEDNSVPLGSSQSLAYNFLETDVEWLGEENLMKKMRARIAELEAKVDQYQMKEWLTKTNGKDGDSFNTYFSTDSTQVTVTSCENSLVDLPSINFDDHHMKEDTVLSERTEIGIQTEIPSVHLESHCHELENELERVRGKIINILSEQKACTEENCALKQTLQLLINKSKLKSVNCDNDVINASLKFLESNKESTSDRFQSALNPQETELPVEKDEMECLRHKRKEDCSSEKIEELKQENEKLKKRCEELVESLELMKVEYEKTEEYWDNKLNEERKIFELDQRQSDEKFAELEQKIQEYAEIFAMDQAKRHSLPPIEEKDFLERQFTELEEEYEAFRANAEEKLKEKDDLIERLQSTLENKSNRKDRGVQTTSGIKYGTKHRFSASTPKEPHYQTPRQHDSCWCVKGKMRDRLKFEVENLCQRKQILINQITCLQTSAQLSNQRVEQMQLSLSNSALSSKSRHQDAPWKEIEVHVKNGYLQLENILKRNYEKHKKDLTTLQNSFSSFKEKMQEQEKTAKQQGHSSKKEKQSAKSPLK